MIASQTFALLNLVIWTMFLVAIAITERRGRNVYHSRHRRIRYRRLSTAAALKRIREAEKRRPAVTGRPAGQDDGSLG